MNMYCHMLVCVNQQLAGLLGSAPLPLPQRLCLWPSRNLLMGSFHFAFFLASFAFFFSGELAE